LLGGYWKEKKAMDNSAMLKAINLVLLGVLVVPIKTEEPLLLSPYLKANNINGAQRDSMVPAQGPLRLFPPSHAGYLTVDEAAGNHMFFWFIKSLEPSAPLVMWLNGGPTVSSMLGLLWENGPATCKYPDKTDLQRNDYSWHRFANMLYIDNPTGTGFSYSENDNVRFQEEHITRELFSFMQQFFELFPEFKSREFYVGGQSYAGKYVPSLALHIHNMKLAGNDMPLTGIYLGGPLFDPHVQFIEIGRELLALGKITTTQFAEHERANENFLESNPGGISTLPTNTILNITLGPLMPYMMENTETEEYAGYDCVQAFMNKAEVKNKVHAGSENNFVVADNGAQQAFGAEFYVSTTSKLAVLMDNYKVLLYNGHDDGLVSTASVEAALAQAHWSKRNEYRGLNREWVKWGRDAGGYSLTGQFCRVVIYNSGHQVPHDQARSADQMMRDFIDHGCIQ